MNYGELKAAVASYLHRADLATETEDTFIKLAEADIRRDVRMREGEATTTLTLSARAVAVPAGFLAVRRIVMNSSTQFDLQYLPPEKLYTSMLYHESGQPCEYTIEGSNFVFAPNPSDSPEALLHYYKAFDALVLDADTNALLTNYPGVYLFASLKHAYLHILDQKNVTINATAYNEEVAKVNKEAQRGRKGNRLKRTGIPTP